MVAGAAVSLACSSGGLTVAGLPVFAWCALWAYGLQWLVFVPAHLRQTERFFDLTGSLTYLSVVGLALWARPQADPRALLIGTLVAIWALRLGVFLARRVHRAGGDRRFEAIMPHLPSHLMTWTMQGLWVVLTLAAGLAAMTSRVSQPLGVFAVLGAATWLTGFVIEVAADAQKSRFRADPANRGRFIHTGLWAWSRHPNYFGEILLWIGIAVIAWPALSGWQYVGLVSPLFVALLLTRISGIPLLERRADKVWGGDPAYQAYRRSTPRLLPRPPKWGHASFPPDPDS